MKKIMLVMDEPESCADCQFKKLTSMDDWICCITGKIVEEYVTKVAPSCPFIPMKVVDHTPADQNDVAEARKLRNMLLNETPTLRDYFAGQALAGIITGGGGSVLYAENDSKSAYKVADAMLAARAGQSN